MSAGVLGVIPARYAAVRFPGKPLAMLWGKPMLQHVWERANAAGGIDELVIATDDERIARAARGWGAEVEMTSPECASGTDRVAELARRRPGAEIILNLQGDEPELETAAVSKLIETMQSDAGVRMGTIAHHEPNPSALASEDVVKVTVDPQGFAIDFTRTAPRAMPAAPAPLRHAGVYAFRRDFLFDFASWPRSPREISERLEQLRALERGVRIKVVMGQEPFTGVDTPEQLAALQKRRPSPS